jgi:hypothetical protein
MRIRNIVFYVNHHGLGHARRSAIVLAKLITACPELRCIVRTHDRCAAFFRNLGDQVVVEGPGADIGAVEKTPLEIDPAATVKALKEQLSKADVITLDEEAFLRKYHVSLILADIPFSMAEAGRNCGIKIIGVSNFTWDWIYEPFFHSNDIDVFAKIASSYACYDKLLRLPFGQQTSKVKEVVDIPLVAEISSIGKLELSQYFKIDPKRRSILVSFRGGVTESVLARALPRLSDFTIYLMGAPRALVTKNVIDVDTYSEVFSINNFVRAADVVISKLGYATVADCIAGRTSLVYVPRTGFREDTLLLEAGSIIPLVELPTEHFLTGNWLPSIESALGGRFAENVPLGGAEKAAELILADL